MNYNTRQSQEILSFLQNNKNKHMTAEEVFEGMRTLGSSVGRTTVYRHLERLYKDGKIRKFLTGDKAGSCYQLSDTHEQCQSHYHLRCNRCGKLIHTECDFLNELAGHVSAEHGFTLDPEKTVIYGICSECKEK